MRIAIVYDGWFPGTLGGAERWLDELASQVTRLGHEVHYVTRAFPEQNRPSNYRIIPVDRSFSLYRRDGTRRLWPALRFAYKTFKFLVTRRLDYDLVYVAQAPLWPVIAASLALMGRRERLIVEWLEWWPLSYWVTYAGGLRGFIGYAVQRAALVLSPRCTTYTDLTLNRLLAHRHPDHVQKLPGMFSERLLTLEQAAADTVRDPVVLFVGRLVPDKHPELALEVMAVIQEECPEVRCVMVGEGPLLGELRASAKNCGLAESTVRGATSEFELDELWRNSIVLLHPSAREGYGLVVAEAFASGTPVVVLGSPENAAVELVDDGANGLIVANPSPEQMEIAVRQMVKNEGEWRSRVRAWFRNEFKYRSSQATAKEMIAWATSTRTVLGDVGRSSPVEGSNQE